MKDRANPGVRVLAKLPNDNKNGLIPNLWNPVYAQKSPDRPNTPSRSISMSITGFGSRVTLTSNSGVPIPKTSLIGSHKGLISPSRSLEQVRCYSPLIILLRLRLPVSRFVSCCTYCIPCTRLLHATWVELQKNIGKAKSRVYIEHNELGGDSRITILCDATYPVKYDRGMCTGGNNKKLQSLQCFLPVRSSCILRAPLHSLGRGICSRLSSDVGIGGPQR